MATGSTTFCFDPTGFDSSDFVAQIPAGLNSRHKLFAALRRELKLPGYFGENWDALADCLRDLSWIEQRRVIIQ